MTWEELKNALTGAQTTFTMETDQKPPIFTMEVSGVTSTNITFTCLGGGANKKVFRVKVAGEDQTAPQWVLAVSTAQSPGTTLSTKDIQGEINVLSRLGENHILVPEPFMSSPGDKDNFRFQINIGGEYEPFPHPVFIEEFIPENIEIKKLGGSGKAAFFEETVFTQASIGPDQLKRARGDLEKLRDYLEVSPQTSQSNATKTWNDFQVMYKKTTGEVVVIDPMEPGPGRYAEDPGTYIAQWLARIDKKLAELEPSTSS